MGVHETDSEVSESQVEDANKQEWDRVPSTHIPDQKCPSGGRQLTSSPEAEPIAP